MKQAQAQAPPEKRPAKEQVQNERTRSQFGLLPPVLVGICLLCMIAGRIVERSAPAAAIWLYLLYGIAYFCGGLFGMRGVVAGLRHGTVDIDLLMMLAAAGAALVGEFFEGALLLFLFSFSNVLQDFALDRTRNAVQHLIDLRPAQAEVLRNNVGVRVAVEEVAVGELVLTRPGENIALDGTVVEGRSAVDQSLVTGESRPVPKGLGDDLLAGTVNLSGSLTFQVTRAAVDTTLAKLIQLVEQARGRRAKTQRFLERFEQRYALLVIAATIITALVPLLFLGELFQSAFYRAITLMVAASPCALIISTPATILAALAAGARRGLLFKGGIYIEQAARLKVIAFDKTGTLTFGNLQVTDVVLTPPEWNHPLGSDAEHLWHGSSTELVALTAAVEARSEHAVARATLAEAHRGAGSSAAALMEAVAFESIAGYGVQARVDNRTIRVGKLSFFDTLDKTAHAAVARRIADLEARLYTVVVVGQLFPSGRAALLGFIAFEDRIRPAAGAVVARLRQLGVQRLVMITGDNRAVAEQVGAQVGLDEVHAGLLPDGKLALIDQLAERYGAVGMVGDGVNDAPALAQATLGIAMGGAGADVALETADIILMADDLRGLPSIIELSRRTRRTLLVNLGLAGLLILLLIVGIFGLQLPLPVAVIGHEGGTVLVALNGLRLLIRRRTPDLSATIQQG